MDDSGKSGDILDGVDSDLPAPPVDLPLETEFIEMLGVRYVHCKTQDGGDLYLTRYGAPLWEHLMPENWLHDAWFKRQSERLMGTSFVYKLPTRPVNGRGLNLVVKWSRVGETVPVDTMSIDKFVHADFNSPFEEFAIVSELRAGRIGPSSIKIRTQKPLAIFVPPQRLKLWQTGRSESRIAAILAQHPGIELDIQRQYVLIYEWVKGMDLTQVGEQWKLEPGRHASFLSRLTTLAIHELEQKGYHVVDMKPAHVIVRPRPNGTLLRDRKGQVAFAVVDYELLKRTPMHEAEVQHAHRQHYLRRMAHRFAPHPGPLPPHLKPASVFGVDYIFGHAESTGGQLWVVGHDPDLFNYFLPERWRRNDSESLSKSERVFKVRSKDQVNLVWRVSRVGEMPGSSDDKARRDAIRQQGFNSPFEEFSMAIQLARAGIPTIYPRAIYLTSPSEVSAKIRDPRRFESHAGMRSPGGDPVLPMDREAITIWGYFNGLDESLAERDGYFYKALSAANARRYGILSPPALEELLQDLRRRMHEAGFEDPLLTPDHILLSIDPEKGLVCDMHGRPETRLCNFAFVRPLNASGTDDGAF